MDPSNFKFLKVGKFGKSTILQRNVLTTTQMLTICLKKVYTIVARDPPILDFLESEKFWKVYRFPTFLQNLKILHQKDFGLTDFCFGYDRENDDKNKNHGLSTNLQQFSN